MQSRGAGVNINYKTYARVRPIDYQSKMIETSGDASISIRAPSSKYKEKQSFTFNGVFDQSASQETIWAHVCEPCVSKVIEGTNSCILSYGQTAGGKTYSIFGEDDSYSIRDARIDARRDRRGLVPRTVEHLFRKAKDLEDIREFVVTCSMSEIYVDQIRDLGKAYMQKNSAEANTAGRTTLNANALTSNFENERLAIYENANGQVIIKDLTFVPIKSIAELHSMISEGLRERFVTQNNQLWARAHTIFTVNLVQKDKENENIPVTNSTIQFVDLAGSESIPKNLRDGLKFQEAVLINKSLISVGKCLQNISRSSKSVPYRESQLTHVLQNCMATNSFVSLIVNIHPAESNYEECMTSLQFAERTKILQPGGSSGSSNMKMGASGMGNSGVQPGGQLNGAVGGGGASPDDFMLQSMGNNFAAGNDKLIKSLKDQIKDLETKIEFIQRENKSKMLEVQTILGIEVDLDKIISRSSQKDLQQFKQQREAVVKLENVSKLNQDLESEIAALHMEIKNLKIEQSVQVKQQSCSVIELRDQVRRLKEQISANKMQYEDEIRKLNAERESEIKSMIDKSNTLLTEKASMILNLPNTIQNKTNENQKINDLKRNTRQEVEKELKPQIEGLKVEYTRLLETSKAQYEQFLKAKNEQIEKYVADMAKYRTKKKKESEESKRELLELYDTVAQQGQLISKVEIGHYSGGKRSVNIPSREKPIMPSRSSFQLLYKHLDQRQLKSMGKTMSGGENGTMTGAQMSTFAAGATNQMGTGGSNMNVTFGGTKIDNESLMMTTEMAKSKSGAALIAKTFPSTLLASQTFKSQLRSERMGKRDSMQIDVSQLIAQTNSEKDKEIIMDLNVDLVVNLNKIKSKEDFPQLKVYAERMKESLHAALIREKELKERVREFEQINNNVDIKGLQKERDEFKSLYMQEMRKNNSSSRGSNANMDSSSRRLLFLTASQPVNPTNQMQRTSSPNGFRKYSGNQQVDSSQHINVTRPGTNSLLNRQSKAQDKSLLPLFK